MIVVESLIFGKKESNKKEKQIQNYLAKVNHYLDILDKRISVYYDQLEKVSRLIDLAAQRKEKDLLVKALRARNQLKKNLKFYLGQREDLNSIVGKIQQSRGIKDYEWFMKEGREIMEEIKPSPETIERGKVEVGETMDEMETAISIISEPISESGFDDLEGEAERLMAEKSLPDVEQPSKEEIKHEEESEIEELEEELEDLL